MSKILVIDDDPTILALYRNAFRAQGFEVETAGDGEAGLRAAQRSRPDVILLDLSMPELTGGELLHRLREQPSLKGLPVVVLTAGAHPEQVATAMDAGVKVLVKGQDRTRRVVEVVSRSLVDSPWAY